MRTNPDAIWRPYEQRWRKRTRRRRWSGQYCVASGAVTPNPGSAPGSGVMQSMSGCRSRGRAVTRVSLLGLPPTGCMPAKGERHNSVHWSYLLFYRSAAARDVGWAGRRPK